MNVLCVCVCARACACVHGSRRSHKVEKCRHPPPLALLGAITNNFKQLCVHSEDRIMRKQPVHSFFCAADSG